MKKVLMIVFNDMSCDSRVEKEGSGLAANGYNVTVLCFGRTGLLEHELRNGFEIRRIRHFFRITDHRKIHLFLRPLRWLDIIFRFLIAGLKAKPDIVHCHDVYPLPLGIAISKIRRIPLVYDSHELCAETFTKKGFLSKGVFFVEHLSVKFISALIMSDGQSRVDHFRKTHGYTKRVWMVRNCPVLPDMLNDSYLSSAQMRGEKVTGNGKILIYLGGLGSGRGLLTIIEALKMLPNSFFVSLSSPSEYREVLLGRAKELGVAERVRFLPTVNHYMLPEIVSQANIGLCLYEDVTLSRKYSCPTKIYDYMLAGIPVIVSNFPEMERLIEAHHEGPAGIAIDPCSSEQLVAAVELLNNRPGQECGRRGREVILSTYNWGNQGKVLLELYDNLVLTPGRSEVGY